MNYIIYLKGVTSYTLDYTFIFLERTFNYRNDDDDGVKIVKVAPFESIVQRCMGVWNGKR